MRVPAFLLALVLAAASAACTGLGVKLEHLPPDAAAQGYRTLSRPAPLTRGAVTFDCGPEALGAVLNFYGKPVDVLEITKLIYDPDKKGTLATAIPDLARTKGLAFERVTGSVGRLKNAIDRDRPTMIMTQVDKEIYHFFVIVGYNDKTRVVVCEEYSGSKRLIGYEALDAIWRPTRLWCLEFYPAGEVDDLEAAQELEAHGEFVKALALFRRVLASQPEHADALVGQGRCLKHTGKADEARASYEHALKVEPDHPVALVNLADLLVEGGKDLDRAAELASKAAESWKAQRASLQAELAKASGFAKEQVAQEIEDADYYLGVAYGTLGQAHAAAGRAEAALAAFAISLERIPADEPDRRARRMMEMGDALRSLGKVDEAQARYAHALEVAKDSKLRALIEQRLK